MLFVLFHHFDSIKKGGFLEVVNSIATCSTNIFIQRNNYRNLLSESMSIMDRMNLLFYWKCLMHYCLRIYSKSEDKRSICMHRLAPTLKEYAEFANE